MLRYLNSGVRRFGGRPIWAHRRANWEFYAVLKGQCGVLLEEKPLGAFSVQKCRKLPLKHSHLWVFPPQHDHGWYGKPDSSCQVAAFHFNRVPEVLENAVKDRDFLEQPLSAENGRQIRDLVRRLEPGYKQPTSLSNLRADGALIELILLVLADAPVPADSTRDQKAAKKVESAVGWFTEHLRERPTFEEMAAAVHASPTQLRRLFNQVREDSPQHAMNEIRAERAGKLLADSDEKLDFIAHECGFSSASNFCRWFKEYCGSSPSQWRKRLTGYEKQMRAFGRPMG